MHATQLLDKAIRKQSQAIHMKRRRALIGSVQSLLNGKNREKTGSESNLF